MADPTTAGGGTAKLRSGLADALKRRFGVSAWQAEAHAASLLERGPLADFLARASAEQARVEAEVEGVRAAPAYEVDASGKWCWVVWAISETRAQLAAICSTEKEAKRQIENVPHLYPDSWAMHERAPVDHTFGAADLKSLHWRSALSDIKRRRSALNPPEAPIPHDRDALLALVNGADLLGHVARTLEVGAPRLDPKTREAVARQIALKVRLALRAQVEAEAGRQP